MFANWKERLAAKRVKNKLYEESRHWKNNPLLQDCLQAMRGSCTVVPPEMHEAVITAANIALREDIWSAVDELTDIPADFFPGMVYIVWGEASLPVLMVPWNVVSKNLDEARRVNSDTFLVSETMDRILWFDKYINVKLYSIT